jgi:hypothetical protein
MYDAAKSKGIPTALVMFEGEQHGFRQAANVQLALDGELYFLSRVLEPSFDADIPAHVAGQIDIVNFPK